MSKNFKKPTFNHKRFERLKVAISQVEPMDMSFAPMVVNEYELLVMTIYKLNDLIKVTNSYTELIGEILEWVLNEGLEQSVLEQLNIWLNDGTLEVLINETLFNMKLDKTEFEDYKVLLEDTLTTLENNLMLEIDKKADKTYVDGELDRIDGEVDRIDDELEDLETDKADKTYVDVELDKKVDKSSLPILFDGSQTLKSVIEQAILEDRPIQIGYGEFEIHENIELNCNNANLTIRGYGKSQSHAISRLIFRNNGLALKLTNIQNFILEDVDIVTQTVGEEPFVIDVDKNFAIINGSLKLKNVFIRGFNQIFTWNGGYYHTFDNVIFSHFRTGFNDWHGNNVTFNQCNFSRFDFLIRVEDGHGPISFEQCVIEYFGGAVVRANDRDTIRTMVNFTNCYIENGSTIPIGGSALPMGNADVVYGCGPVSLIGNFIFTNNLARVVSAWNTSQSFLSKGNVLYYRDNPSNVLQTYLHNGNLLEWADISDVAVLQGEVTPSTVLVSGLPNLIAKGTSRIYNPFTKTMET